MNRARVAFVLIALMILDPFMPLTSGFTFPRLDLSVPAYFNLRLFAAQAPNRTVTRPAAAAIPGSFAVSETGSANYVIDLPVPPAPPDLAVRLSLAYDSNAGNTPVGVGWSLTGLSSIQRCPSTVAQHGEIKGVEFRGAEPLCLDGQLLVAVAQNPTYNTYRTEAETYTRVREYLTEETIYYVVETKAGLALTFGRTPDSAVEAQGRPDIASWHVNRIEDRSGNYVTIRYYEDSANTFAYPELIEYAQHDRPRREPYASIAFEYESRDDRMPLYLAGARVTIARRMQRISITSQGRERDFYRFSYDYSPSTLRSRLIAIDHCATDAECGQSTRVTWPDGGGSFAINTTYQSTTGVGGAPLANTADKILTMDHNGDGKSDLLVYRPGVGALYLALRNSNNQLVPVIQNQNAIGPYVLNSASDRMVVLDYDGDGRSDILVYRPGGNRIGLFRSLGAGSFDTILYSESGFMSTNLLSPADTFVPLDYNGDSRSDLVLYRPGSGRIRIYKSRGTATFDTAFSSENGILDYDLASLADVVIPFDFNGDQLSDLLIYRPGGGSIAVIKSEYGDHFEKVLHSNRGLLSFDLLSTKDIAVPLDFNGDSQIDILVYRPGQGAVLLAQSLGNGSFESAYYTNNGGIMTFDLRSDADRLLPLDFNADRRSDILGYRPGQGAFFVGLSVRPPPFQPFFTSGAGVGGFTLKDTRDQVIVSDQNGDGRSDMLLVRPGAGVVSEVQTQGALYDLVAGIADGHGATVKISYKPLTDEQIYTKGTTAVYPYVDVQGPLFVVADWSQCLDSSTGCRTRQYRYAELEAVLNGRGLNGFQSVTETDSVTGIVTRTQYYGGFPLTNLVYRVEQMTAAGTRFLQNTNIYTSAQNNPAWEVKLRSGATRVVGRADIGALTLELLSAEPAISGIETTPAQLEALASPNRAGITYSINLRTQVERKYELNDRLVSETTREYTRYDSYGNPEVSTIIYSDGVRDETIRFYSNKVDSWQLGLLMWQQRHVTSPNRKPVKRLTTYTYDARGRVDTQDSDPDPKMNVHTRFAYDGFGNVREVTATTANAVRTTTYEFDIAGRFPERSTNALGHTTQFAFDARFGKMTRVTDPNGVIRQFEFDWLGRDTKESRVGGGTSEQSWLRCVSFECPSGVAYELVRISSSSGTTHNYYDALGRPVRQSRSVVDGRIANTDIEYEADGVVRRVSRAYFAGDQPVWTRFKYDGLRRRVVTFQPDGTEITSTPDGLTIRVSSAEGRIIDRDYSPRGELLHVKEGEGSEAWYNYNATGQLEEVRDAAGDKTVASYDAIGNRDSLTLPRGIRTTFRHNPFGELVSETNERGQVTSYFYDRLGRLERRTEPEGETTWTYDSAARGLGKLHFVRTGNRTETYTYDTAGRIESTTAEVGNRKWALSTTYDSAGRPSLLQYPTGFTVRNSYASNGDVVRVSSGDMSVVYWALQQTDARGLPEIEQLGNGLYAVRDYNQLRGTLNQWAVQRLPLQRIEDRDLDFDADGFLRSETDAMRARYRQISYDDIGRLEYVTESNTVETTKYDAVGNMLSRVRQPSTSPFPTASMALTYGENNTSPYALTTVTANSASRTYKYDASGNLREKGPIKVQWTSFGTPSRITLQSGSVDYLYDADHRLLRRQTRLRNDVGTTWHIGGIFEEYEVGGRRTNVHFVNGASGVAAAVVTRNDTTLQRTFYIHRDHVGSLASITDETGSLARRFDYDVWGAPKTASGQASDWLQWERQFAFRTRVPGTEFLFGGKRLYEPGSGRFLSPDPVVAEPEAPQDFNRYSYAANNPTSFADPTDAFLDRLWSGISNGLQEFGHFLQNNWQMIVAVGAAVALTIATGGMGAGLAGAFLNGALMGAVTAGTYVALRGGNLTQVVSAATTGMVIGAFAGIGAYGINAGVATMAEALPGGAWSTALSETTRVAGAGIAGGMLSELQGGTFKQGFESAVVVASAYAFYKIATTNQTAEGRNGFEPTLEPATEPADPIKTDNDALIWNPKQNHIGNAAAFNGHGITVEGRIPMQIDFLEGDTGSRLLNNIPGMNSHAVLHDSVLRFLPAGPLWNISQVVIIVNYYAMGWQYAPAFFVARGVQ